MQNFPGSQTRSATAMRLSYTLSDYPHEYLQNVNGVYTVPVGTYS